MAVLTGPEANYKMICLCMHIEWNSKKGCLRIKKRYQRVGDACIRVSKLSRQGKQCLPCLLNCLACYAPCILSMHAIHSIPGV
jgi:hypothetical protein